MRHDHNRYGHQPIAEVLHEQRWTAKRFARDHGLHEVHFGNAVAGIVRPNNEVRKIAPRVLGVPLEDLFTPRALEQFNSPWPERRRAEAS